jgi:hypothetical protein
MEIREPILVVFRNSRNERGLGLLLTTFFAGLVPFMSWIHGDFFLPGAAVSVAGFFAFAYLTAVTFTTKMKLYQNHVVHHVLFTTHMLRRQDIRCHRRFADGRTLYVELVPLNDKMSPIRFNMEWTANRVLQIWLYPIKCVDHYAKNWEDPTEDELAAFAAFTE